MSKMRPEAILDFVGSHTVPGGGISVAYHEHISGDRRPHFRTAMRSMLFGWAQYAVAHQGQFESPIGEDYILGVAWKEIGAALLDLLNGELGGFDGGSLDANIRNFAAEHGINLND